MPSAWFLATFVHWGTESQSPTSSSTTTPRIRSSTSFFSEKHLHLFFGGISKVEMKILSWQPKKQIDPIKLAPSNLSKWQKTGRFWFSKSLNPQYLPKKKAPEKSQTPLWSSKNWYPRITLADSWFPKLSKLKVLGKKLSIPHDSQWIWFYLQASKQKNTQKNQLGQISNPSTKLWYVLNLPVTMSRWTFAIFTKVHRWWNFSNQNDANDDNKRHGPCRLIGLVFSSEKNTEFGVWIFFGWKICWVMAARVLTLLGCFENWKSFLKLMVGRTYLWNIHLKKFEI